MFWRGRIAIVDSIAVCPLTHVPFIACTIKGAGYIRALGIFVAVTCPLFAFIDITAEFVIRSLDTIAWCTRTLIRANVVYTSAVLAPAVVETGFTLVYIDTSWVGERATNLWGISQFACAFVRPNEIFAFGVLWACDLVFVNLTLVDIYAFSIAELKAIWALADVLIWTCMLAL